MRCLLICFCTVEYHLPHRVARQFGRLQPCPPEDFSTSQQLHKYVPSTISFFIAIPLAFSTCSPEEQAIFVINFSFLNICGRMHIIQLNYSHLHHCRDTQQKSRVSDPSPFKDKAGFLLPTCHCCDSYMSLSMHTFPLFGAMNCGGTQAFRQQNKYMTRHFSPIQLV